MPDVEIEDEDDEDKKPGANFVNTVIQVRRRLSLVYLLSKKITSLSFSVCPQAGRRGQVGEHGVGGRGSRVEGIGGGGGDQGQAQQRGRRRSTGSKRRLSKNPATMIGMVFSRWA